MEPEIRKIVTYDEETLMEVFVPPQRLGGCLQWLLLFVILGQVDL